jgi:hypothetical protein
MKEADFFFFPKCHFTISVSKEDAASNYLSKFHPQKFSIATVLYSMSEVSI